jgi:UV DNA damage endonuclease
MRLGYACINLTLGRTFRTLRLATLKTQGMSYVQFLVHENMTLLTEILHWNREHGIMMYRLSSELVPFGSSDAVNLHDLDFSSYHNIALLAQGMRLSTHPGQFTLPSAQGSIWEKSVKDLRYHACLMNILGIDGDIVIHGGGVYGDRATTADRIKRNILSLPAEIRCHLRLENDERSWSVTDLLPICEETGVPLIVDALHHQLYGSVPLAQLPWSRIMASWSGRLPKLHYSEQNPAKRAGAHSEYIDAPTFERFMLNVPWIDYDVMLECKAKELALLKLRTDLAALSPTSYH